MNPFTNELYELADRSPSREPSPAVSGEVTGVALPDQGPISNGAIISSNYARQLGAQLILAADEHDNLLEAGRQQMMKQASLHNRPGPIHQRGDGHE